MILFSIVYGKKYIDFLIDRAIPSLMTPRNKLFLEKTDNILYIATISEDVPYIRKQLRSLDLEKVFGDRIRIHHIPYIASKNDHEEPQRQNKLSYALLMRAMRFCYEQNQPFFFIPPDTIFSEELLEICWDLHQVTGKIVAVFNGRVSPLPETTNVNNSILARPDGVKRYFLENMDTCWLNGPLRVLTTWLEKAEGISLSRERDPFMYSQARPIRSWAVSMGKICSSSRNKGCMAYGIINGSGA